MTFTSRAPPPHYQAEIRVALSPSTALFPLLPRLRRRSRCSGTSRRGEDRCTFTLLHTAAILRRSLHGGGLPVLADWPRQSCGEGAARGAVRRADLGVCREGEAAVPGFRVVAAAERTPQQPQHYTTTPCARLSSCPGGRRPAPRGWGERQDSERVSLTSQKKPSFKYKCI